MVARACCFWSSIRDRDCVDGTTACYSTPCKTRVRRLMSAVGHHSSASSTPLSLPVQIGSWSCVQLTFQASAALVGPARRMAGTLRGRGSAWHMLKLEAVVLAARMVCSRVRRSSTFSVVRELACLLSRIIVIAMLCAGPSTAQPSQVSPALSLTMDTNLARQGSNFGLPIALQLVKLMEGGVGILEVCCSPGFPSHPLLN